MITDIRQNILSTLGSSEEYLIDRYPVNYFNSYIDIGARGTVSPNHVNHIGTNNPETQCIAYEPDIPYISELESKTQDLDNVHCNREGYGLGEIVIPGGSCASVTLSDIVEKYKIDAKWVGKGRGRLRPVQNDRTGFLEVSEWVLTNNSLKKR